MKSFQLCQNTPFRNSVKYVEITDNKVKNDTANRKYPNDFFFKSKIANKPRNNIDKNALNAVIIRR